MKLNQKNVIRGFLVLGLLRFYRDLIEIVHFSELFMEVQIVCLEYPSYSATTMNSAFSSFQALGQ